jgi:hypothetical protein
MRTGKRVVRTASRGVVGFVAGMILGVVLEEERRVTSDQAFYIGVGSGLLAAGISWRRSGR